MERASVKVKLKDGKRLMVEGYACRVAGIDMVVHPMVVEEESLSSVGWVVSERNTGRCVTEQSVSSPEAAIRLADDLVMKFGGRRALEEHIEKLMADE